MIILVGFYNNHRYIYNGDCSQHLDLKNLSVAERDQRESGASSLQANGDEIRRIVVERYCLPSVCKMDGVDTPFVLQNGVFKLCNGAYFCTAQRLY